MEFGFPLGLEASNVEVRQSPFRPEFLASVFPTLEWPAVVQAARAVGVTALPEEVGEELLRDEGFLQALHHVLLDVHVIEGALICPDTGRRFEIRGGVPNMQLDDDTEVLEPKGR